MAMKTLCMTTALMACLAACDDHGHVEGEPEFTGCGTDENWRTFDDQEQLNTPMTTADSPVVTAPAAGATVAFAAPITIHWQPSANDAGSADGNVPHDGPGCNNCCPQWTRGGLTTSHLPPISGDVYDLRFTVDGSEVWRTVTTLQAWAPDPATDAWSKMRGKTVSLMIWRMSVLRNDVKMGPFATGTAFTFTVGN
jgi:hypothetical protein